MEAASSNPQGLGQDQDKLLAAIAGQLVECRRAEREAVRQEVQDACDKEHGRKRKQLEDAAQQEREKLLKQHEEAMTATEQERDKLVKQHEEAMAAAQEMAVRRTRDSKQCAYIIRGNSQLSGSIPCQIFEAEPNSVLNKVYNGEWAYAVDEQGRACINSDPAHWPLILNWLSFGSVPSQPSDAFIAECKYWQLDNLLAKIQQQRPAPVTPAEPTIQCDTAKHSTSVKHLRGNGRDGFQLECRVHDFVERFIALKNISTEFRAFGSLWAICLKADGAYLKLNVGPPVRQAEWSLSFGTGQDEWKAVASAMNDFTSDHGGWGLRWQDDWPAERVQRYPLVDLTGSLHFTTRVLFHKTT